MDYNNFISMLDHAKYKYYVVSNPNETGYVFVYFQDKLNNIYYCAQFNQYDGILYELYTAEKEEYSTFDWDWSGD